MTTEKLPTRDALFELYPTAFDVRNYIPLFAIFLVLGPIGTSVLSWYACSGTVFLLLAIAKIIQCRYPHFMRRDVMDDLQVEPGLTLTLAASVTALLLQSHNSSIAIGVHFHSDFWNRPFARLLRTSLFVSMALEGTSEEKEQTASWLRFLHRHIHGAITEEMRIKFGIRQDISTYGYIDELKAYTIETLAWTTIAFQDRFGRTLSRRARDAIVLEYTCVGLRLGIPENLLAKDYDSFVVSFDRRLDALDDDGSAVTRMVFENITFSWLNTDASWMMRGLWRFALMVGFDLLPERLKRQYQLDILKSWWACAVQRVIMAMMWAIYPILLWLPLRGMIALLLVLEPSLRPVLTSTLQTIHSMDILSDTPVFGKATKASVTSSPSYLAWLESGRDGCTFLQCLMVKILATQVASRQPQGFMQRTTLWARLPLRILALLCMTVQQNVVSTFVQWSAQIKESQVFMQNTKFPRHIGFVMDGNRRYARNLGQPVLAGHQKGAQTAGDILAWWLRSIPNTRSALDMRYLTVWAFSAENHKRSEEELRGLFTLMETELKSLAFTSMIHLFHVRVQVIGSRDGLPRELLESIRLLEELTAGYSALFLQVAVGYVGRDEIVRSVKSVIARGGEVTEKSIGEATFCAKVGVPPVDLIVRTSERRTSGFFLWDTQAAELHFIDKLWPELTEMDWIEALKSFGNRELRCGK